MECPAAQGAFRVDYDLPMENVVDYELGGAKGTYLFDPDHRSMSADSPGFTRFVEEGVEHIVLGWDHVLFLVILLLGASSFKRRRSSWRRPSPPRTASPSRSPCSAWSTSRARSSSR